MAEEKPRDAESLECVVEEQEIRRAKHDFSGREVNGYEWRLRVKYPATETSASRSEWLPRVFGSTISVDAMLAQWTEFLSTHGHSAKSNPSNIKLVKTYQCQSVALNVAGRIENMTDLIFGSRVFGGGDSLEDSPYYRLDLETVRRLYMSLADAIAVAEGKKPPSVGDGTHH